MNLTLTYRVVREAVLRNLHTLKEWIPTSLKQHKLLRESFQAKSVQRCAGKPVMVNTIRDLSTLASDLSHVCSAVEPNFLELGQQLQSVSTATQTLTAIPRQPSPLPWN